MLQENRSDKFKNVKLEKLIFQRRLFIALGFVAIAFLFTLFKLHQLTITEYSTLLSSSQDNQLRISAVLAPRGLIRDRNGIILARNDPYWSLTYTPELAENQEYVFNWLLENNFLDQIKLGDLKALILRGLSFSTFPVAVLSEEQTAIFAVNRYKLAGLDVSENLYRHYPYGPITAHVIGYVGAIAPEDNTRLDLTNYLMDTRVGRNGLEYYQEKLLHGDFGRSAVIVNSRGRVIRDFNIQSDEELATGSIIDNIPPVDGESIELTLDIHLQELAYSLLEGLRGAVVAIKPKTGEILVLASSPTFDPNPFSLGISQSEFDLLLYDDSRPLYSRATSGTYPPGSTIKPFLALAALELNLIDQETTHFCSGSYSLPGNDHQYRDWLETGHGNVSLSRSIAQSCDVFYYNLATDLGIENISSFLRQFGFGSNLEFGIGVTQSGILPSVEWKRDYFSNPSDQTWFPGETVITGIGQGYFSATPLQIAVAGSILANRGTYVPPKLINGVMDVMGNYRTIASGEGYTLDINNEHFEAVFNAMDMVTHSNIGSAYSIFSDDEHNVIGKTGTAQVISIGQDEEYIEEDIDENLRDHGLFFGFAPMEDPEILVLAIIENSGSGSRFAAPIVKEVIDSYFEDLSSDEEEVLALNYAR